MLITDIDTHLAHNGAPAGRFSLISPEMAWPPPMVSFMFGDVSSFLCAMMFGELMVGPLGCYRLSNVRLTGDGVAIHGDTMIAAPRSNHPAHYCVQVRDRFAAAIESGPRRQVPVQAAMLIGPGVDIWGHWLIDFLPRLYLLAILGFDLAALHYPLPAPVKPFVWSMLARLGIQQDQIIVYDPEIETLQVAELLLPTNLPRTNRFHPMYRQAVRFLCDRLWQTAGPTGPQARLPRLFVTRRASGASRQVRNREAIERIAVEYGYAVVDPGAMALTDQMAMFQQANLIAGEYGSGLHNCIFSRPGTFVCALRGTAIHPGFSQSGITQAMGQRIGYVFGRTPVDAIDQEFEIDEGSFRRALDCMELLPHAEPAGPSFAAQAWL